MASHIIQKAADQVGGAKRARSSWGLRRAVVQRGGFVAFFMTPLWWTGPMSLPWSHPNKGDPHCRQSIISPASHRISHIVPSCEPCYDTYVAWYLRAMIHHLHGCRASQT